MPSPANGILLASLGLLLGLAGVLLARDTALAHGTCSGTSSVSVSGATANYESISECNQDVNDIHALATLWSYNPFAGGITDILQSVRYEDFDLDTRFFTKTADAQDDHGVDTGRCFVTIGTHGATDTHWRWTVIPPPHFDVHVWTKISSSPGILVCRL